MNRTEIPGLRRSLPPVIQGATAVFGDNSVDDRYGLLDDVLAAGIDAFDTGMVYVDALGTCDGRLGSWIAERGIRHDVTVIGKGCHPAPPDWSVSRVRPECVAEDLDRTLDRMGTDYLDLWLFHRDDTTVPVDELADAAAKLVVAGLADAWGFPTGRWIASGRHERCRRPTTGFRRWLPARIFPWSTRWPNHGLAWSASPDRLPSRTVSGWPMRGSQSWPGRRWPVAT